MLQNSELPAQSDSVFIEKFSNAMHLGMIQDWAKARNHGVPEEHDMPALGAVAFVNGAPIAVGHIRRVEGGYGQIDGFITNPHADPEMRNKALDVLLTHLLREAESKCRRGILSFSRDKNTIARAERHGFTRMPKEFVLLGFNPAKAK